MNETEIQEYTADYLIVIDNEGTTDNTRTHTSSICSTDNGIEEGDVTISSG